MKRELQQGVLFPEDHTAIAASSATQEIIPSFWDSPRWFQSMKTNLELCHPCRLRTKASFLPVYKETNISKAVGLNSPLIKVTVLKGVLLRAITTPITHITHCGNGYCKRDAPRY